MANKKDMGVDYVMDLSDVVSAYDLSKEDYAFVRQSAVDAGIAKTYQMIVHYIRRDLKSTRQIYYRGLSKPIIERLKGSIQLSGALPNMLEQGADAFDMKKGFQASRKAKKTKKGNGWYLTIPFRWASPTSIGENEAFSKKMDMSMRDLVNDKGGKTVTVEEIQSSRSTYGIIGERAKIKPTKGLSSKQRSAYQHKVPMGAGASRQIAPYKVAVQGKVVSFRRVSGGGKNPSAENSWINRGLEARNFMPEALHSEQVKDEVGDAVEHALNMLGK